MKRKSSRRDFLRGRAAADVVADSLQRALPTGTEAPGAGASASGYLLRISRRAMACQFEIVQNVGQYKQGTEVALAALDVVESLEAQLSVFTPSSEVSRLNEEAAHGPVAVEPRLFGLLQLAAELHRQTGGALDVTAGALSEVWGFSRREGSVPDQKELDEALKRVGTHLLELDPREQTVRFRRPGVRINLGCIGKGHALDRCAETMTEGGVEHFLIHGGGSSILARGDEGVTGEDSPEDTARGWVVGIPHPWVHGRRVAEVRLRNQALGTSGSRTQSFRHKGRRYGHILDPRTGMPAEGLFSSTVIAPTAAVADALSTTFFVFGHEQAEEFCRHTPGVAAVLVFPAQSGGGVAVRSIGQEEAEIRILDTPADAES
ncbi:MAG: FAD:protein FMN transferase [Planctomycetes bacterium]|nr:FAD:protein FMN transferase [Planctomycetota bacterium]